MKFADDIVIFRRFKRIIVEGFRKRIDDPDA